jgi:hypothetical protein
MDIPVSCSHCHKEFRKSMGRVNEARKFGWKFYCSLKCQFQSRLTGVHYVCQKCGKKVWRTPKETRASKSQRFFCSSSCAAMFNNKIRVRYSKNLGRYYGVNEEYKLCAAENCKNQLKTRSSKYCSRACANAQLKKLPEQFKKEILSKIQGFYKTEQRIPLKSEMYGIYKPARRMFGNWNKAIEAAGFSPNPVMFAKKYVARDGHVCDSLAEKIIDEWLYAKKIPHLRSVPYSKENRITCDFVVGKYFIEFFGLEGYHRGYMKQVEKKRKLAKKLKLKLIELKPADIFPKNNLAKVLSFLF